jgi:hypothetical protein
MNSKTTVISLILIISGLAAHSQFFVDVYYGYNHSNEKFILPDEFKNMYNIKYYSEPIDTIYHYNEWTEDTIVILERELLVHDHDEFQTQHNFYSHHVLGIDCGYKINEYIKSNLSYNYINLKESLDIKTEWLSDTYNENVLSSRTMAYNEIQYKIQKLSLGFSVNYPYKKFEAELFISGDVYYTKINHKYWEQAVFYELNTETDVVFNKWEYSGISYGCSSGIGLSYNVYKNLSVFTKYGYSFGELVLRQGKRTDSSQEGFVPEDIDKSEIPFNNIPFNGFNFRIGLRYEFGSTGKNKDDNDE